MHADYRDIIEAVRFAGRASLAPLWWDENGTPRFASHDPKLCPDIYANEVVLLRISCQECEREFLVQMSAGSMNAVRSMMGAGAYGPVSGLLEDALGSWEERLGEDEDASRARIAKMRSKLASLRATKTWTLARQIEDGIIHYGDPPRHDDCAAGDTMNCNDLEVVEFWRQGNVSGTMEDAIAAMKFRRVPELERKLPIYTDGAR